MRLAFPVTAAPPALLLPAVLLSALALSACAKVETAPQARTLVVMGKVQTKLFVSPMGRPLKCLIIASSGDEAFDRKFCRAQIREASYAPARDEAGKRVQRIVVSSATLPSAAQPGADDKPLPDFIFLVSQLPGDRPDVTTRIELDVDEAGAIRNCHPAAKETDKDLADVACGSLAAIWKPLPEQEDDGAPFPYVREFLIALRRQG